MIEDRIQLLLDVIDHSFDKPGWQGPNLCGSLRGVDAKLAARAIRGRKSISQQVLHAAYWKNRALNTLVGTQRFPRAGSNWPQLPETITTAAWKADIELLRDIHRHLRDAVAALRPEQLDEKMKKRLYGVAAHDAYHTGQINLMKKLLGR